MGGQHSRVSSGLAEVDFVEGRNVVIDYRWADTPDRMAALAADLISRKVAVIVTGGNTGGVRAVLAATRIIPIVFTTAPIRSRPGLLAVSTGREAMRPE